MMRTTIARFPSMALTCSFFCADATAAFWPPLAIRGRDARPGENARVPTDDATLVKRVAEGDHDAFALLYDRYGALVFGIAKRVLGNREQAEDVTQSIFLQICTRPEMFPGGNFGAWVARVARNASVDVLRSAAVRKREPVLPLDLPAEGALEEQVFDRVRASALTAAVAALP